jgi:hypothetical protein
MVMNSGVADGGDLPGIPWGDLRPYMSVVVLKCRPGVAPEHGVGGVFRQLLDNGTVSNRKIARVVALEEISNLIEGDEGASLTIEGMDRVSALVRESSSIPSWAVTDVGFVNVNYDLNVILQRGELVAVKVDRGNIDKFQTWLDKRGSSLVERIAPDVLEYTFLMGEAKGLWLQGASGRSAKRPDAKTSVGIDLRETLDDFDDGAYALSSARCDLPDDPGRVALKGRIGSTVRTSQLWLKPMDSFDLFVAAVGEVFDLIEVAERDPEGIAEAFPQLAREVSDLSEVSGAYDVSIADVDQLPLAVAEGEETQEAATILQRAVLQVVQGSRGAKVKFEVGLDGVTGGRLTARPERTTHGFRLEWGRLGDGTYGQIVDPVFRALENTDLVSIYYESGHVYSGGRITKRKSRVAPFRNWEFGDFSGVNVKSEKPFNLLSATEVHRCIGAEGDDSLFGWVLRNFGDGFLTCDDGAGEIADFLQLDWKGTLRFIHVKGAENDSLGRRVSSTAYEQVAMQAAKNLLFLEKDILVDGLRAGSGRKASWVGGERVDGRDEFIEYLDTLGESSKREVVIVQPHQTEAVKEQMRAREAAKDVNAELLRFRRLEVLLNLAYSSVVRAGAELVVYGSK